MRLKLRVTTNKYIYEEYEPNIYFYKLPYEYVMQEKLSDRVNNILYLDEE